MCCTTPRRHLVLTIDILPSKGAEDSCPEELRSRLIYWSRLLEARSHRLHIPRLSESRGRGLVPRGFSFLDAQHSLTRTQHRRTCQCNPTWHTHNTPQRAPSTTAPTGSTPVYNSVTFVVHVPPGSVSPGGEVLPYGGLKQPNEDPSAKGLLPGRDCQQGTRSPRE